MSAEIIGLDGSKIGSNTPDSPELTDIVPPADGNWINAAKLAMAKNARWGALIFSDDEGEVRAIWINTDRPSFRGLIEEVRDALRMQLQESLEEC